MRRRDGQISCFERMLGAVQKSFCPSDLLIAHSPTKDFILDWSVVQGVLGSIVVGPRFSRSEI